MKVSQIFSSDVAFTFRSIVHSKTILYGVRIQSRFIFSPYGYQVVAVSFVGRSLLSLWNYTGVFITFQLALYV